jgi:hypothetical protein
MRLRGGVGAVMRILITAFLSITWYGLAIHGGESMASDIVRLALLGGVLVVWLDEHWLDVDIKLVIPALLLLLLNQSVKREITQPYEGYPREALLWLGLGWIVATLLLSFVLNAAFRARHAEAEGASAGPGDAQAVQQ